MGRNWQPRKQVACPSCGWAGTRVVVAKHCPQCGKWCPTDLERIMQSALLNKVLAHAKKLERASYEKYDGERCFNLHRFLETLATDLSGWDEIPSSLDCMSLAHFIWLCMRDDVSDVTYKGVPTLS